MSRTTMEDVARVAGVARGTVSRVLNGGPVSEMSRRRVEDAIRQTGYQANAHARSLASGRSNVYAAVLTEPYGELFEDPTFGELLKGISSALVGGDVALSLVIASTPEERKRALRLLHPSRVDGVIHLSPHIDDPVLAALQGTVPLVVCGWLGERGRSTWSVTIDDVGGGRQGARHVLSRGARRVGVIAGPVSGHGANRRLRGQQAVLGDQLDPALVVHGAYAADGGATAMARLLELAPDIDAVLCASDRQASGAISVLHQRGRRVPDDVLVVGFDDHRFASQLIPPLTSIRQPVAEVGAAAVRLLDDVLAGRTPESLELPTELIVRESA